MEWVSGRQTYEGAPPVCRSSQMLVASGLSPYGGLYRVLSAPACGNRWGPSMDNLLPMCERKLSLPRKARSPLPGPPFSPFGWPGSRKARLHELLSAWRMFQTGSSEDVNVAPLRMSNKLHCGYWSAVSPCVSSTQVGGPPRQQKQRSSATLPREKTPRTPCRNPLLLLPRRGEVRGAAALPPLPVGRGAPRTWDRWWRAAPSLWAPPSVAAGCCWPAASVEQAAPGAAGWSVCPVGGVRCRASGCGGTRPRKRCRTCLCRLGGCCRRLGRALQGLE